MSSIIWVGKNKNDETTLQIPSAFLDDTFELILRELSPHYKLIYLKVREDYIESAYGNLTQLDMKEFRIVSDILLKLHSNSLYELKQVQKEHIWIKETTWLKTALAIDIRADHSWKREVKIRLENGFSINTEKWCVEFLLELLISQHHRSLSRSHLQKIYTLLEESQSTYKIESAIAEIFTKKMKQIKIDFMRNKYIEKMFTSLADSLHSIPSNTKD